MYVPLYVDSNTKQTISISNSRLHKATFIVVYVPQTGLTFYKVCRAIPLALLHLIQNILRYCDRPSSLPTQGEELDLFHGQDDNSLILGIIKKSIFGDYEARIQAHTYEFDLS